jgi:hypothetical protein
LDLPEELVLPAKGAIPKENAAIAELRRKDRRGCFICSKLKSINLMQAITNEKPVFFLFYLRKQVLMADTASA